MPAKKAVVKKAVAKKAPVKRKPKVEEVTHREIYQRVVEVEGKVENINMRITGLEIGISEMLRAFNAAKGAFDVLTFIGKLAKPLAVLAAIGAAIVLAWQNLWKHGI